MSNLTAICFYVNVVVVVIESDLAMQSQKNILINLQSSVSGYRVK